jgi:hypothetical protein
MGNLTVRAALTGITAALMALLLFMVAALNQPFNGPIQVSRGAYAHAPEMFNVQNLGARGIPPPATSSQPSGYKDAPGH